MVGLASCFGFWLVSLVGFVGVLVAWVGGLVGGLVFLFLFFFCFQFLFCV